MKTKAIVLTGLVCLIISTNQSYGQAIKVISNGNVGLGTPTPDEELSVIGISRAANDTAESEYTEIGHDGSNGYINTVGDGNLDFRHDSSTKMVLTSDGHLGINVSSGLSDKRLYIDSDIKYGQYLRNTSSDHATYGLFCKRENTYASGYSNSHYGIYGFAVAANGIDYGVYGRSTTGTAEGNGQSYGVYGLAGNASDGYNFGVYGNLYGSTSLDGAAVYGTTNGGVRIDDRYAGYFNGSVKITNDLWVNGTIHESDERLKKNIQSVNGESTLGKVLQMKPVSYKLEEIRELDYHLNDADTGEYNPVRITSPDLLNRNQIGLLAQDLEKIYPELVYTSKSGLKGINYVGLIPVLIQSLKEQQSQINGCKIQHVKDSLKNNNLESRIIFLEGQVSDIQTNCCDQSNLKNSKLGESEEGLNMDNEQLASLSQNQPNPFTQATEIRYFLPEETQQARLYVYDMQGKPVKNYKITDMGNGSHMIQGSELTAGMYLYTLIADGKEVDTKRMILTE